MKKTLKYAIPSALAVGALASIVGLSMVGASPDVPVAAPHQVTHSVAASSTTDTTSTVPVAAPAAPSTTTTAPPATPVPAPRPTTAPAATTPTTVPDVEPPLPAQPPAADASQLTQGQCAIAVNSNQQNPVTGQWGVDTVTYFGSCQQAEVLASLYPGAIVVPAPDAPATTTTTVPPTTTTTVAGPGGAEKVYNG